MTPTSSEFIFQKTDQPVSSIELITDQQTLTYNNTSSTCSSSLLHDFKPLLGLVIT